ncbi:MAG: HNH endonuclease [Solirubrobacterales bacterium]|nr:HNH endonuclease [Solirubrobacterales bacterium]
MVRKAGPRAIQISRKQAVARLDHVAARLRQFTHEVGSPDSSRETLDEIIAELRSIQLEWFGRRGRASRGSGAKAKILAYLRQRVGQVVQGEEVAEVSGIGEWARRVRELRVEDGYEITEVGSGAYRLESAEPNLGRAETWNVENEIRRREGSGMDRIAALFEARVGEVVDRKQIDYVSKIAESARRVRELRDEHGWPINSYIDEPDLGPTQYRLTSTDSNDRRDPLQRLYPESLRQQVFERDGFTCQICGRDRVKAETVGDTRFYLEVHHKIAVADELEALPKSGRNEISNLMTLCHADHFEETAKLQKRKRRERGA